MTPGWEEQRSARLPACAKRSMARCIDRDRMVGLEIGVDPSSSMTRTTGSSCFSERVAYERIVTRRRSSSSLCLSCRGEEEGRTEHSAIPACKQLGGGWRWQYGMLQLILILVCLSWGGMFPGSFVFYAPSPGKINTSFSAVSSSALHGIAILQFYRIQYPVFPRNSTWSWRQPLQPYYSSNINSL